MREDIADLSELMEVYRRRSKEVPFQPIAAAYAEAADDLQELLAELKASGREARPHPSIFT